MKPRKMFNRTIKYRNTLATAFSLFSMLLAVSCSVQNEVVSTNRAHTNMASASVKADTGGIAATGDVMARAPQIIFLDFSIKRTPAGNSEVSVINKIVINGELKKSLSESQALNTGDLRCVALDVNSRPIKSITIPNPLRRTVEYVSESGQLSKKDIEMDSTQFSVRMQLDAATEAIAIEQRSATDVANTILLVTKIR